MLVPEIRRCRSREYIEKHKPPGKGFPMLRFLVSLDFLSINEIQLVKNQKSGGLDLQLQAFCHPQ
jgi:hypothetical protein